MRAKVEIVLHDRKDTINVTFPGLTDAQRCYTELVAALANRDKGIHEIVANDCAFAVVLRSVAAVSYGLNKR